MASWVLFISSLSALALLVLHSRRSRGGRVTAVFFIGGAVFGVLRGNAVWAICEYCLGAGTGAKPYLPQGRALPHVGHESLQVVIGWLFAAYLAWTLSESLLRRIGKADRLFATVGLASLFMACIGYSTEAVATRVGWWYWDFSTVNPVFGSVPAAGIAAWFSVALDFLFPVLLIECSEYRKSPWRWLALLVFPLHMGAHALYNVVPYIDNMYAGLVVLVAGFALFGRTRLVSGFAEGRGAGELIPTVAVTAYLGVILWAGVVSGAGGEVLWTAVPLLVFALLGTRRVPLVFAIGVAALGLAGWGWVGWRALYALAPVAGAVAAGANRGARVVFLGAVVLLAGLYTMGEVRLQLRMKDYVGFLRCGCREQALAMEFKDADPLWWSVRNLLAASAKDPESCLPEVLKRYEAIVKADPAWVGARLERAGWLAADNHLAAAVEECRVAVDTEPTVAEPRAVLGYFLLRSGRLDEAKAELMKSVELGGDSPDVRTNLAVIAVAEGDAKRARELLTGVQAKPVARLDLRELDASSGRVRPDLAHVAAPAMYEFLGLLMFKRADRAQHAGDMKDAVRWGTEAAHYVPHSVEYRTNLAVFLANAGDAESAVDQCEVAAELEGRSGSAKRNLVPLCLALADRQAKSGNTAQARNTLQRALPYASDGAEFEIRLRLAEMR